MNNDKKILIAYFSAQGTTKKVAIKLSKITNGDLYEIKPEIPYSKEDLKWFNENSRTAIECKDEKSRTKLLDKNAKIENYEIIFLGFPIWFYNAPPIIKTFLETYDFNNKKIYLFATSGGSQFGETVDNLNKILKKGKIIDGKMLNRNPSLDDLTNYINSFQYN